MKVTLLAALGLIVLVQCALGQRNSGGSRGANRAPLAGGWSERKIDEGVKDAAKFATVELSKSSNSLYHDKVVEIISAKSQVVSGVKYEITYTAGRTTCHKHKVKAEDVESCELDQKEPLETCVAVVWSQPWLQKKTLLKIKCEPRKNVVQQSDKKKPLRKTLSEQKRLFQGFQYQYKKVYSTPEESNLRFKIFQNNLKRIDLLNKYELGTGKYGITEHADLSAKEFYRKFLGLKPSLAQKQYKSGEKAVITRVADLPESFDWREKGAVTEVKNQGSCGSCWAFSTTGNVEGQWFLSKGQLISLSEQELVDCDKLDQGCNGGLPSNAYEQIEELGGLEQESDYPYEGEDEKCSFSQKLAKVNISGWVNVSSDETDMANFLVTNGPLSIGINANAMQFYFGGISHPPKFLCSPSNLDHGVLIVGYGVHTYPLFHKTLPFWIVKNSWGATWGEQGYYRVYRGDGTCGLNKMVTSAKV